MSEAEEIKTKKDKTFYQHKMVIKGRKEILTLILKSTRKLYDGALMTDTNDSEEIKEKNAEQQYLQLTGGKRGKGVIVNTHFLLISAIARGNNGRIPAL